MSEPRALLIALREPDDAMFHHEHGCFARAARLPLANVDVHPMSRDGRPSRSHMDRYDVIFFGGSGAFSVLDDVEWIRQGMHALEEVAAMGKKAWASCFGFQGLALALGAEVINDDDLTEMGSTWLHLTEAGAADPVTGVLPASFWAQEGHHDHVMTLPKGVTLLAAGDQVRMQAFKVDGVPFYASQFHPELRKQDTLDRFIHYRDHYIEDDADAVYAMLAAGEETDEVAELLPRIARL